MWSYKKIGLSHEMGLIDTPPLKPSISFSLALEEQIWIILNLYLLLKCSVAEGR